MGRESEWVDGIAFMRTRMGTVTPSVGLERTEDISTATGYVWSTTSGRPVPVDAHHRCAPRRHRPAAGSSEVDVPAENDRPVDQVGTLMISEDRGRQLGMLMKLKNLRELTTRFPGHGFVQTC